MKKLFLLDSSLIIIPQQKLRAEAADEFGLYTSRHAGGWHATAQYHFGKLGLSRVPQSTVNERLQRAESPFHEQRLHALTPKALE